MDTESLNVNGSTARFLGPVAKAVVLLKDRLRATAGAAAPGPDVLRRFERIRSEVWSNDHVPSTEPWRPVWFDSHPDQRPVPGLCKTVSAATFPEPQVEPEPQSEESRPLL